MNKITIDVTTNWAGDVTGIIHLNKGEENHSLLNMNGEPMPYNTVKNSPLNEGIMFDQIEDIIHNFKTYHNGKVL